MFEWDRNNLRKIRTHRIKPDEAEQVLLNDPIPIYEQHVGGELRFVYYGESNRGRLIAVVVTERGERLRVITAYDLDAGQRRDYHLRRSQRGVKAKMDRKMSEIPKFRNESDEADWWASRAGKAYVKKKAAAAQSEGKAARGSTLVAQMNRKSSVQIAIRLPQTDLAQARKLAERKGLGYQTLLKMLVHEGLSREARRG